MNLPDRARMGELAGFAARVLLAWLVLQTYSGSVIEVLGVRTLTVTELIAFLITRAFCWALLTPFFVELVHRFPWRRPHRLRNGILLLLAIPLLAAIEAVIETMVITHVFAFQHPFWRGAVRVFVQPGILMAALAIIVTHFVMARRQAAEHERRQAELEATLVRVQAEQLRERFRPSFLYAALDSIDRAAESDPARAERLLTSVAELLRMAMELDGRELVPLEEELDFVDRYVALHPSAPPLRIDADPASLSLCVPPRVVQSFVEGVAVPAASAIDLQVRTEGELLLVATATGRDGLPLRSELRVPSVPYSFSTTSPSTYAS